MGKHPAGLELALSMKNNTEASDKGKNRGANMIQTDV
jgi:hypothetical protein